MRLVALVGTTAPYLSLHGELIPGLPGWRAFSFLLPP
jgi:hypothetical protein